MTRAWTFLLIAVVFEIIYAISLKESDGYTKFWPTVINVASLISDILFLAYAFKTLPLGTGYAIWTGLGAVGVAIYGIWFYQESINVTRLAMMGMIIVGAVGLRFTGE